jgi:rRNA biogenesis protein RRP5
LQAAKQLRVTRKASLLSAAAAGALPASLADVSEGLVLPGYVASVTADAVFVRFLGELTGRAGLAQLSDTFVSDPGAHFSAGQSVRGAVVQVDRAAGRFSVALKQSLCGAGDAAFVAGLLADLDAAAAMEAAEGGGLDWGAAFPVGGVGEPAQTRRNAAAAAAARKTAAAVLRPPGGRQPSSPPWPSRRPHARPSPPPMLPHAPLTPAPNALPSPVPPPPPAVSGEVHGVKDYGVLCDMAAHPDVVGLAAPHQVPAGVAAAEGAPARGVVLDLSKKDGIVDLSLNPALVARAEEAAAAASAAGGGKEKPAKKKRGKAEAAAGAGAGAGSAAEVAVGERVTVRVELVKADEGYCVVSLPAGRRPLLGLLPTADFNLPPGAALQQPQPGDELAATVAALPAGPAGRLLLHAPLGPRAGGAPPPPPRPEGGRPGGKNPAPLRGTLVTGTVEAVHPLHADVALSTGHRGRVHITEAADGGADGAPVAAPLAGLTPGAAVSAVVLGRMQGAEGRRHGLLELTTRASALAGAAADPPALPASLGWGALKAGATLGGYVQEVAGDHVWAVFSPAVRGRAFVAQAAGSLEACAAAGRAFRPGAAVTATVVAVNAGARALDVAFGAAPELRAGATALGVVTAVGGGGVRVQLGARASGRVALSDIHDAAVPNALEGLAERQFVRVCVLGREQERDGPGGGEGAAFALSLRPSRGGACPAHASRAPLAAPAAAPPPPEALAAAALKAGQKVSGYVKSAGPSGVFVCLARGLDARVRLRQLADTFVDDPAAAFPAGARVEGAVVGVEGGRVELTLRARRPPPSLGDLEEGQVVRGRVRRVEPFGVFVQLEGGGASGLAHVSELADGFVADVTALFAPGQGGQPAPASPLSPCVLCPPPPAALHPPPHPAQPPPTRTLLRSLVPCCLALTLCRGCGAGDEGGPRHRPPVPGPEAQLL